eukprot:GHVL01015161.1.p1 GENE.GHVL01015161.1~~GHVL01015161.1.p1  ORF type:complete len:146 (-),score=9.35 GHVL01015161.1:311-748(-)
MFQYLEQTEPENGRCNGSPLKICKRLQRPRNKCDMHLTLYTFQRMVPPHVCQASETFVHGLKCYDRLKRGEKYCLWCLSRNFFFKEFFSNCVSRSPIGCVSPSRMRIPCSVAEADKNCSRVLNTAVLYKKEVKKTTNQKDRRMQT